MKQESPPTTESPTDFMRIVWLDQIIVHIRRILVPAFAFFVLTFAMLYAGGAMIEFMRPILDNGDVIEGLVKGLHMGVVALAVYELAQIVAQEYDAIEAPENMVRRIRSGLIRFVSV